MQDLNPNSLQVMDGLFSKQNWFAAFGGAWCSSSTDVESVSIKKNFMDLANINKSRHLILIRLHCFGNVCPT